jgi:hypothetical protein
MEMTQGMRLDWSGRDTLVAGRAALARGLPVEIHLPANYHHALFARIHPEAAPAGAETLDVQGGPELLAKIAEIDGLQEFGLLFTPASETQARVHIRSPSPTVIVAPVVSGH